MLLTIYAPSITQTVAVVSRSRLLRTIGNTLSSPVSIPEITEPWRPFQSHTDFEFTQHALDAVLTKAHVDKIIQLVERCIRGQDSFNLMNHHDLHKTWDAASTLLAPVSANVTAFPH